MSLWVKIYQQGMLPGHCKAVGKGDSGRGFSNAAFLVSNSEDGHNSVLFEEEMKKSEGEPFLGSPSLIAQALLVPRDQTPDQITAIVLQ
jgi:hypothetical protein